MLSPANPHFDRNEKFHLVEQFIRQADDGWLSYLLSGLAAKFTSKN
jgi:hypothetical protein